jgi:hypothetical protein
MWIAFIRILGQVLFLGLVSLIDPRPAARAWAMETLREIQVEIDAFGEGDDEDE